MGTSSNKYRAAIEVLQKGRDLLVDDLTAEVLDRGDDLAEGGFMFHEFLETQGTRLHFLSLIVSQLEQSAEMAEEADRIASANAGAATGPTLEMHELEQEVGPEPSLAPKRRRGRSKPKKLHGTSAEGRTDDA
jgi:hypothetical protein